MAELKDILNTKKCWICERTSENDWEYDEKV